MIVRVGDADDVSRVGALARGTGLELAVRGGGHSLPGHGVSDRGNVRGLSKMRALEIDAGGRTAWAEPGLTAGEYTTAAGAHGLAPGLFLILPATPDVITTSVAEAEAAAEELSTIANVMLAPPLPFVPPEHHGRPIVMATLAYAGGIEEGQRAVAPFRALATLIADMVRPTRCPEIDPPEPE